MNKLVSLLVVALLAVHGNSYVAKDPRDLAAEVQKLVDELAFLIQGQITAAHGSLDNTDLAFLTNSNNVLVSSQITIAQERDSITEQLNIIKNLANNIHKDISVCTEVREPILGRLPEEYVRLLKDCIQSVNEDETQIISRAKYTVDITANKVNSVQFQVDSCKGNLLCLTPIVTEIDILKAQLPQVIKQDVEEAVSLLNSLRVSIGTCSNNNISQYTADASSLLSDITRCVNQIIS